MNSIMRQRFDISTSATKCDTGAQAWGEIVQARWEQTGVADTGADLQVYVQQREADTGDGVKLVLDDDCLGTDFTKVWRQPMHNSDGVALDTGNDLTGPVYLAGERLRVRVVPAGGTVTGKLYVWIKQ